MPCAKLCRPFFVYTYFLFVVCPLPYAFVIPPVYHQGYDTMTLYYISFSEKINSVINNNAIYVLGSFYNIKCHPVTRRQIVRRAIILKLHHHSCQLPEFISLAVIARII